jgi:spermidine synthase
MVVAVFVLCIALGSFLVSALARIPPWLVAGSQWLLVLLLAGLYLVIPDAGYGAHVLRTFFRDHGQAFYMYQAATFAVGLAILMVPIGLSGALLPLLFHHLRNEVGDLGRIAGSLYSWNTVGSLAGALLGGYLLLFWLDLHHAYAVALGALAVGAGILTYRVAGAPMRVAGTLTLAAVVAIALLPEWDPMRLPIGTFRKRAPTPLTFAGADRFLADHNRNQVLLFHDDDPVASVVVLEAAQNKRARSIFTNGKPDGSTSGDYPTMCFAALIPALLTDDPSRGFVIGWGTGVTVGELAALPENEEVVVAEISPGVIESAPLFSSLNQRADKNPKVKILRSDAYRALLRSEGRFGVIASEPSNPWVSGVENLFSREFLEAARSRLTPGGIYAQWFHLYEVDAKTVEIVAATYASVFDQVAVWFAQGPDVLLIGMNDSSGYPDLATLRERFDQSGMRRGMARCSARSFEQLLAHELIPPGLLRAETVSAPIHSLHHPILSQNAAHAFFSGRPVELPRMAGSADANDDEFPKALLTQELGEGPIPEATLETVARYICRARRTAACAAWVARWRTAYPESAAARSYDPRREKRVGDVSTLSPAALHRVEQLMRRDLPASDPFWNLANLTHYFSIYYTHTAPFDRSLLRDQWSACLSAGSQAAQCETARARSDQELSRFHVPRRGGS